jgi:hypothetical protein
MNGGDMRRPSLNRHLVRLLLALYPPAWRVRYGAEVVRLTEELIAAGEVTPAEGALNLMANAAVERGRALADSRRTAVAMALAAVVAVAGSFYAVGHGPHLRPASPARPASAAPVPASLTRVLCAFPRVVGATSAARLIPGGPAFALSLPAGTKVAAAPRVLVPVSLAGPGSGGIRLCVELSARCRIGRPGTVTAVPGARVVQVMIVPRGCALVSLAKGADNTAPSGP